MRHYPVKCKQLRTIKCLSTPETETYATTTSNTQLSTSETTSCETPTATISSSKLVSTENLIQRQQSRNKQQPKGRRYKSRTVVRRLNLQKKTLAQLAKKVHHGSKQDLLLSMAQSVAYPKNLQMPQKKLRIGMKLCPHRTF